MYGINNWLLTVDHSSQPAKKSPQSSSHMRLRLSTPHRHRLRLSLRYQLSFGGDLAEGLLQSREEDIRRGITNVGPHDDDLD